MNTIEPTHETYRLWRIFTDPATGQKVVAMTGTEANIFISVYTILIGLIMAFTWAILISFTILFLTPRKMTRTTYIAVITAWDQSEPWSSSMYLGEHCWRVLRGVLTRKHPAELTWKAFWFDIALLAVGLITGLGGFALGPVFSGAFAAGNIAPVNPRIVYQPLYSSYTDDIQQRRVAVQYDSIAALKAFGNVDSAEASSQDTTELIKLDWQSLDSVNEEDRYSIQYSYKVTGADMGLQKLRDLTLEVSGNCTFQDTWWFSQDSQNETPGSQTLYEIYIKWAPDTLVQYPDVEQTPFDETTGAEGNNSMAIYVPLYPRATPVANFYKTVFTREFLNQETGRDYFVMIPLTGMVPTVGVSTDPWYATRELNISSLVGKFPYMVKDQRPPLLCQENNEWSSGSWRGTMKNLLSNGSDGPPVPLPIGIASLIKTGLGAFPMMVTLGLAATSATLRSATHLVGEERAIDTENARARDDIKRLVQASYLATRDIFRNSALAGSALKADISSGALRNALADSDTGEPLAGTDGFVITSSAVQSLSLSALITVPCLLVVISGIALLLQTGRKLKARNVTSKPAGRFDRYINLVTGLKASQLYRMVDQLIADRAPSDKEGYDSESHRSQAQWKNQTGNFPFIASNRGASSNEETIIPQFHVQVKGDNRRLILDVERVKDDAGHWRSLRKSDGKVSLAEVDRQVKEEGEYRGEDRNQQPAAPTQDRIEKALPNDAVTELEPNGTDIEKPLHKDVITELNPAVQTPYS